MSFPDFLLGDGLYKLGYVTTDLDWAIEHCQKALGFERFLQFEPSPQIRRADGRSGPARLRCAFSTGRERVVELMRPLGGLVDIWADPLIALEAPAIVFHHVGVLVDDLAEVLERAGEVGMHPVQQSSVPGVLSVAYLELPGMGHWVELCQYDQGVGGVLAEARAMRHST
jgi:hypothetical protein